MGGNEYTATDLWTLLWEGSQQAHYSTNGSLRRNSRIPPTQISDAGAGKHHWDRSTKEDYHRSIITGYYQEGSASQIEVFWFVLRYRWYLTILSVIEWELDLLSCSVPQHVMAWTPVYGVDLCDSVINVTPHTLRFSTLVALTSR